jgi:potassium-transporting ATPase KdpC subunit
LSIRIITYFIEITMRKQMIIALKFLLTMTILTGIIYPLLMTGLAQLSYRSKANGSMININGKIIGSELIGQKFDSINYFWSRPSATGYNAVPSGATNWGPTSDTLKKQVESRRRLFAKMNSIQDLMTIPNEMIFASGSGLDPHISPEAAMIQVDRIVKARHLDNDQKEKLIKKINDLTELTQFLLFGEARINVVILNIELDKIDKQISKNK